MVVWNGIASGRAYLSDESLWPYFRMDPVGSGAVEQYNDVATRIAMGRDFGDYASRFAARTMELISQEAI